MSCNKCNNPCHTCSGHHPCDVPCACPVPFLGISQLPDNISVLRFNLNGVRADYDYQNLIYQVQSDTTLVADVINRILKYTAERHQDTLTAQELGAILHLADIGDVSSAGAADGSMLTYQKSSNCTDGCVGANDTWKVWNALDSQVQSATYPFVFTQDGKPRTLNRPQNPNQYYQLGWNAQNQLSYSQIPIVPSVPPNGIPLYVDPETNQIVGVQSNG